ncbi:glycine cleavage H-family protein [Chlamydia ibidis]|uniref:Glycine cleavage system H-like protein n=2 Tax=Chlamydia ibidis TaxID=1405396 RepID=S7J1T9_9CHLA|nr:glycine cleavage protein H-like protein [Chlamydia ibidis]EPP34369.1 glycine cleavage H-family protein [Chlamydia ibidis]EQM63213.1 glycine cleavage H-family protein [Chlamydia ibidis 10-1398/6]
MWYSDCHVWIAPIHERVVRLGLTQKMLSNLGNIMHVDLPSVGSKCEEGEPFVILESSKSAIEVLCPVSGEVIEINEELMDNTKLLNNSPEDAGWFVVIELTKDLNTSQFSESC